jgi:thioredoxin-related protein
MRGLKIIYVAGIAIILLAVVYGLASYTENTEVYTIGNIKFYSYDKGLNLVRKTGKPGLVHIYSESCHVCKAFHDDLEKYPDLQEAISEFVPIGVNFKRDKTIALKYGATGTPEFYVVDENGKVIDVMGQKLAYIGYATEPDDEQTRLSLINFLKFSSGYYRNHIRNSR